MRQVRAMTALAAVTLLASLGAWAQSPDSTICDAYSGQALGLCKAGVAVGCHDGSGPSQACQTIEENFDEVLGAPAPWVAECLCDYSTVSLQIVADGGPWEDTATNEFACTVPLPDTYAGGYIQSHLRDYAEIDQSSNTRILAAITYDVATYEPVKATCALETPSSGFKANISINQSGVTSRDVLNIARACQRDLIAYGNAFDSLNRGVIDIDQCN